jgi:hypothetical protein
MRSSSSTAALVAVAVLASGCLDPVVDAGCVGLAPGATCKLEGGGSGRCSDIAGCVPCGLGRPCGVTVSGLVLDSRRAPVAGAKVSIAGRTAVVTGADGRFTATDVVVPYGALAALPDGSVAAAWLGLRRADPILALPLWRSGAGTFASLGTWFGGACAIAPDLVDPGTGGAELLLQADPPFRANGPITASAGPAETCALSAWNGDAATTGSLFVLAKDLRSEPPFGFATGFPAYGRLDGVAVNDGAYTRGLEVAVAPVDAATVAVTASGPDGVTSFEASVFFGDSWGGYGFHVADTYDAQPWPPVAIPDVADAHAQFTAWGPGASVVRVVGTTDASADLPLARRPTLLAPADGTSSVGPWTVFSWTPFADGDFYRLEGYFAVPTGTFTTKDVFVYVHTEATSAQLPDFSRVGLAIPGGLSLLWSVSSAGTAGGLDGITSGDHLGQALFDGIGEWDYAMGWSEPRNCTMVGGTSIFDDWDDWD